MALTVRDLAAGFEGEVAPVPLRARFRVGLLLVALATVLLPLAYLALVGLVALLVGLHMSHDVWLLERGQPSLLRLLAYFVPALVGLAMVVFTLKPLLARPAQRDESVRLAPEEAPLLFALVERIRAAVRAPAPREIRVDTRVNASASFRRGLVSLPRRDDLLLTVGLPLLEGLTVRQLGGVLAHELGHFAQEGSMRLTYLIRGVNGWLQRVAYAPDGWDEALARAARHSDWRLQVVGKGGGACVWLTRKALAALALAGTAIGHFLLREMELDADRYQAAVAGSDAFAPTALRVRALRAAQERALALSHLEWRDGRLPDDFAGLVVALADRVQAQGVAPPPAEGGKRRLTDGVFDTHPPDERRIASAEAEAAPGVLRSELPARALLGDDGARGALVRRVSLALYGSENDVAVRDDQLCPLMEVLARHDARVAESGAGERYFGRLFDLHAPLGVPSPAAAPASLAAGLASLRQAREAALAFSPALSAPRDGGSPVVDAGHMARARAAARARLETALSLLSLAEVRAAVAARWPDLDGELRRVGAALGALSEQGRGVAALATATDAVVHLCRSMAGQPGDPRRASHAMEALTSLHFETCRLEQRLAAAPYPFEHAGGALSIAAFAAQGMPATDGADGGTPMRTRALLVHLGELHARLLARLAVLAERIERAAESADSASSWSGDRLSW